MNDLIKIKKTNYDNVKKALVAARGRIFEIYFIKRSTGEERKIVGRLGVKKYLKGGNLKYNPKELNLITIFELKTKDKPGGYKAIPVENILNININGEKYEFGQK